MTVVAGDPTPHLAALELCGIELQAPHLLTTTKRRIETADVDVDTLADDSLRFTGWAPEAIEARFPGLDPSATYAVEAVYVCERGVDRAQVMTSGAHELHPPVTLAPGTSTKVRVAVPPEAYADGTLDVRVGRVRGPDVVLSELRLYASVPPVPRLTVVGDSRNGVIGSVATPDSRGVAGARVRVAGDAGELDLTTDDLGLFRVPLDGLPRGRDGVVRIAVDDGATRTGQEVDTRHVARGLRELPPSDQRLDLGGTWTYVAGPFAGHRAPGDAASSARVPGHIIYDALVPEDGVGTLHRTFDLPATWSGSAVFLRCDGAYGRAEVYVNDTLAAVHGSGATSFDVNLAPYVKPGENALAISLTEYTPHAVLDDMSWYAHMSLLGIWRDIVLFATPMLHLAQLDLDADWDPVTGSGALTIRAEAINLDAVERRYELDVTVTAADGEVCFQASRGGTVAGGSGARETIAGGSLVVEPWSAELPVLYDLDVSLRADGGSQQVAHRRIGFRRVETRGNQLLVNGAPIRVRGVNRHDSRILKGRALSAEDIRQDVENLRRANVNVIRTSHYPPSPHLLDACDELGMFVFEQPPICFSGGFDDHHWTRTNEAAELIPIVLEVTAETVMRDRGRCSVIVWDLANESRWGRAFDAQLALVRSMDPTRPTTFSFDLNELGEYNELVGKPAADRPEIRSYHYPGWDRTWQEDLAWLGAYQQPTVLDEYAPVFAPCVRGPGEGYGLAIDPGIRDYWGAGYGPFVEAALGEHGVIGGLVWGGFGEVFAIPLDLTIGQGPWAHLPVADYVRTHDHYPAEPGVYRRGDGDWGLFDAWNRPRPELWHVHQMYSPIAVAAAAFDPTGDRLEVDLRNRFSHRPFDGLGVRVTGGRVEGAADLDARPGDTARFVVRREGDADIVRLDVWHPEGWLIDGWEWPWPGAGPGPEAVAIERAEAVELDLAVPGTLSVTGDGRRWLEGWPELHVLDVDMPHVPVDCGRTDGGQVVALGDGAFRAPLASRHWEGTITARLEGPSVVFEYDCTYTGSRAFNAREVGLTLRPARRLTDLWWRRIGEWSRYPADHIGRTAGHAAGAPGATSVLNPAPTWPQDANGAGSNDYRSIKRAVLAGGATDGTRSLTVLGSGRQHLRAELVDGSPRLHVLDWYGGVRTIEGNHPIWSAYFGPGMVISHGTRLRGRVAVVVGACPDASPGASVSEAGAPRTPAG